MSFLHPIKVEATNAQLQRLGKPPLTATEQVRVLGELELRDRHPWFLAVGVLVERRRDRERAA